MVQLQHFATKLLPAKYKCKATANTMLKHESDVQRLLHMKLIYLPVLQVKIHCKPSIFIENDNAIHHCTDETAAIKVWVQELV